MSVMMNCTCRSDRVKNYSIVLVIALLILTIAGVLIYFLLLHDKASVEGLSSYQDGDYDGSLSEKLDYDYQNPDRGLWSPQCNAIQDISERIDCYPEGTANAKKCRARGCCFTKHDVDEDTNVPTCYYPPNHGYRLENNVESIFDGFEARLKRLPMPSRYGDDIQTVKLKVDPQTPHRLRITFSDPDDARYEVPEPSIKLTQDTEAQMVPLYSINYNTTVSPFGFKIRRTDTETVIFDTNLGGFTFSSQFLQLSTRLPSKFLYGLGDNGLNSIHLDTDWKSWLLFSRQSTENGQSAYGFHPFYICIENDGRAHGVLLLNSNALEFQVTPDTILTFKAYGGILDFYFFLGPTPKDVIRQYLNAIGHSAMPPYWALGHHLTLPNVNKTSDLQTAVDIFNFTEIALDVVTVPVNRMDSYPPVSNNLEDSPTKLQSFAKTLRLNDQRLVVNLAPGINSHHSRGHYPAYDAGLHLGLYVNDSYGTEPIYGMSTSGPVVYPDFGNPATGPWWTERLKDLHSYLEYDGISLIMNSPQNLVSGSITGCLQDNLNKPAYFSKRLRKIYKDTLCMNSWQWWGPKRCQHYDVHNMYSYGMTKRTDESLKSLFPDQKTLLISSATYMGSGRYAGHSSMINPATWETLPVTLASAMQYGIFGLPFTGGNGCENPENEELCLRSTQLAAFLPYFQTSQLHTLLCEIEDPANHTLLGAVRAAISTRYELLPYLYTLFHHSHLNAEPVASPLWMQFANDESTYNISSQFLWGEGLLICPVLTEGSTEINAYFPPGSWYDYYTAEKMQSESGQWINVETYLESTIRPVALYVRGGYIIPGQIPNLTINKSRRNPMTLFVALDSKQFANGTLYWDDGLTPDSYAKGEYIECTFQAETGRLLVSCFSGKRVFNSDFDNVYIQQIKIAGLLKNPETLQIDGNYILPKQAVWNDGSKLLYLHQITIDFFRNTVILWS